MKKYFIFMLFILSAFKISAQINNVLTKFNLPTAINESSGAIFYNNKLITHNDSGNSNKLHELDTITGLITRTVTIGNATNIDWEDLAQDNTAIYIGDIGNNSGNRTNLKIYKILKSDYSNSTTVNAQTINFSYADQTTFTANPNNTKWDAEALISFDANNLMLFTKDWVNNITKAYLIPKTSGTYSISPQTNTLNAQGLITGATYNTLTGKVYFIGYNNSLLPFVWVSSNFTSANIFSGTNIKTNLTSLGFAQTESITDVGANRYLVTSEAFNVSIISSSAKLFSFNTNDSTLSLQTKFINNNNLYPNPVGKLLYVKGIPFKTLEIYTIYSKLIYKTSSHKSIDVTNLPKGVYLVKIVLDNNSSILEKIVKK